MEDAKRYISSYVYYSPSEAGNYVRQSSFDSFVETCFGHPQPLSPTLHLIPLLRRIQQLRQKFINIGTCCAKDIIRMFWYEVSVSFFENFGLTDLYRRHLRLILESVQVL